MRVAGAGCLVRRLDGLVVLIEATDRGIYDRLVGPAGAPPLMDGGFVSAPSSAVWGPAGEWDAENVGIAPDIEVEHDPALVRQGKDPQLERAIAEMMAELKKTPLAKPKRPAYPNYHKKVTTNDQAKKER